MSHQANKYKLGFFIVTAFLIFLVSIFVLGALNIFKSRIHCMTVVKGSVQGLAVGAKVKLNGVPIGEVTEVKISPVGQNVYIYMNIFPEKLNYKDAGNIKRMFSEFVTKEVKKGLRCQLKYEGITGALYQEMEYFKPEGSPLAQKPSLPDVHPVYIPSVKPVLFGNIMKRIDTSLAKFTSIDKIFSRVNKALVKINKFLESGNMQGVIKDLESTSRNIRSISHNLEQTLTEKNINRFSGKIDAIVAEIIEITKIINKELKASNISETSSEIRSSIKGSSDKLNQAIDNFNSAAASVEALSEELNRSPDSVIWGTGKRKVVPAY
ncbi:MAG: MlaD family protein [Victivallales bacterium]|nr:MlaD family protein [Victivallales bacterium]